MVEKWYRGHQGDVDTLKNFGIIWLADDAEYAQLYANEYSNGIVSTVFVDMDKVNTFDWWYDEDFDPYDPSMKLVKEYMKEQGGNAYTFVVNDGTTVLALLSTEPIIKVKQGIVENMNSKRIILTESQFISLMESQILDESIFDYSSIEEFKQGIKRLIRNMLLVGMSISAIYYTIDKYCDKHNVSNEVKQEVMSMVPRSEESVKSTSSQEVQQSNPMADWVLADNRTVATVYNAVPEQCNADFGHTASMFRLNLNDVLSQRIIAMERTFMKSLGLKYGDVVYLEGVGDYDGVWQIQDTMNKRFAGQKKIDILVPNNIKTGLWKNVKIYKLKDKAKTNVYRSKMAPQLSRAENQKQVQQIKQQMALKNKKRG